MSPVPGRKWRREMKRSSKVHPSGGSTAGLVKPRPPGRNSSRERQNEQSPDHQIATSPNRLWLWPAAITVLGSLAYANSFQGTFVFDDIARIVYSEDVRDLPSVWNAAGAWRRPLVTLTLAINYKLGGLEPAGYHAVNLAVHLLAALALFGVVRRILLLGPPPHNPPHDPPHKPPHNPWVDRPHWPAFIIALLWVVHPLNTQAVTYIIQRAESMMGLFYLLCFYCFLRAVQSPAKSRLWLVLSIVACGLSLWSKAVAVTLPVMILLADRCLISGSFSRALRARRVFYIGLAGTWLLLLFTGEPQGILSFDRPPERATVGFSYEGVSPMAYLLNQGNVIVRYISLSLWPQHLCFDYAWPVSREIADILPGLLVVAMLLGVTAWLLVRRAALGFIGAWFFLILAPTSSFIPIKDLAAEHRMYLPLIAVVAAVVLLASAALRRIAPMQSRRGDLALAGSAIIAIATTALAIRTYLRNELYANPIAMWEDVVAQRASNVRAWDHLGFERWKHAEALRPMDPRRADAVLRQALRAYSVATLIPPQLSGEPAHARPYTHAWMSMGDIYAELGAWSQAIRCFERAIELNPIVAADAHRNIGLIHLRSGRADSAIERFEISLAANGRDARTHLALAQAHVARRDAAKAIEAYERAMKLEPMNTSALAGLGGMLTQIGEHQRAEAILRRSIAIDADHIASHYNLAVLMERQSRRAEAARICERILTLQPDFEPAQRKLEQLRSMEAGSDS